MPSRMQSLIREETRKRCQISPIDKKNIRKFIPINTELFHYLYEIDQISFTIFLQIEEFLVEFIKPKEFAKGLLDEVWTALQSDKTVRVLVEKKYQGAFEQVIKSVRDKKIDLLVEKDPGLDRKTLEIFGNLSNASQLVVRGGITSEVANQVKASAAFLVGNLMDSGVAIATLSRMVTHDPTLYDHSASVAMLAAMIGRQCLQKPLSPKESEMISQCGLYHDVGKTCIPSAVLNKPGRFTEDEFEVMKKHAEYGEEELLKVIESGAPIDPITARVAGEHHERFCGQGYPRGRKGCYEDDPVNGIHLYTRVVTIADVYSALLMKRVYKPSYEPQDAIKIMATVAEKEYDPEIFSKFVRSVVHSLNEYQRLNSTTQKGRILYFDEGGQLREEDRKVI